MIQQSKVIAIVGPTASGKTSLARRLALQYNGELISADSRQVYRGLDIGTGKEGELRPNTTGSRLAKQYPYLRYLNTIPQWLIDIHDPIEQYTVADFQQQALEIVEDIISRDKLPIIVGGTGLYVSALLEGYDFSEQQSRDSKNPRHAAPTVYYKQPPDWNTLVLGLDRPRQELYARIDARVDQRITAGMIEEVQTLLRNGLDTNRLRSFGLEYRYITDLIENHLDKETMIGQLKYAIHAFARRQLTWWRQHGPVTWIKDETEAKQLIDEWLESPSVHLATSGSKQP